MDVPEVGLDNDGDVYVEWWYRSDDTLSMRISPKGIVNWALLTEGESHSGRFAVPSEISRFLERHEEAEHEPAD